MGELLDSSLRALKGCGLHARNIIDVGAHLGGWTREAMRFWPDAEYVLLEPQAKLVERSELTETNVTWICAGAGARDGYYTFAHRQRDDSSTFREIPDNDGLTRGTEVLPVMAIDTLVKERLGGRPPEILKIDAEGWDLEVLAGATSCFGETVAFFVEVGISNPFFSNTLSATDSFMRDVGYRLFAFSDIVINPRSYAQWNAEVVWVLRGSDVDLRSLSRAGF